MAHYTVMVKVELDIEDFELEDEDGMEVELGVAAELILEEEGLGDDWDVVKVEEVEEE